MPEERENPNTLEARLDRLGERWRSSPKIETAPPQGFLAAVVAERSPARARRRLVIGGGIVGIAASLAVVAFVARDPAPPGSAPLPPDAVAAGVSTDADSGGAAFSPMSALSLRIRNEGRSLDELMLPDASVVHWVSGASPF